MSKQIRREEEIYLAPGILGQYKDGNSVAIDKRTGETLDPRNIDHKIKIYEREVKEWFLNVASGLIGSNDFNNGFIVLMICMAYFEGVEQYRTGRSSRGISRRCFKDSVKRLYPQFRGRDIDKLYDKSRCGLFHNGMVQGGVVFSYGFNKSIEFLNNEEIIKINPKRLLEDITNDFDKYLDELKDDTNQIARDNFDRMFNVL